MSSAEKRKWGAFLFAILFLVVMGLIGDREGKVASLETLVESFEGVSLTFRGEERPLRRWEKPVVVYLHSDPGRGAKEHIVKHMDLFSRLTDRGWVLTDREEGSALKVFFFSEGPIQESYDRFLKPKTGADDVSDAVCLVSVRSDSETGEINRALALLNASHGRETLFACIAEELSQASGIMADEATYFPTLYVDHGSPETLSINDKILMRTLYDPRLRAGMTADEAMPIAREVIAELIAAVEQHGEEALYQR